MSTNKNKWKVVNLEQQDLINKECEHKYAAGYSLSRYLGEEGYMRFASTGKKDKLLELCYLTVVPEGERPHEWWADGSARHLYHISELEEIDPINDERKINFLSWLGDK